MSSDREPETANELDMRPGESLLNFLVREVLPEVLKATAATGRCPPAPTHTLKQERLQ